MLNPYLSSTPYVCSLCCLFRTNLEKYQPANENNRASGKFIMNPKLIIGFPTIDVKRNYTDGTATFTQTKFQILENATKAKEYESYRWWVPISYASSTENSDFQSTKPNLWLSKDQSSLTTNITADESSWVIVNVQQTGKKKTKNRILLRTLLFTTLSSPLAIRHKIQSSFNT